MLLQRSERQPDQTWKSMQEEKRNESKRNLVIKSSLKDRLQIHEDYLV